MSTSGSSSAADCWISAEPLPAFAQRARSLDARIVIRDAQVAASAALATMPTAVLRWLSESVDVRAAHDIDWVVALDPVSLQADQRDVRIMQPTFADLTSDQAALLQTDVAHYLREDSDLRIASATLICAAPSRWYLVGQGDRPSVDQPAPASLVGRALREFMPTGSDATLLRRLSTEWQMLLHSHPVNESRRDAGLMPVNGLWWWGGGELASIPDSMSCTAVDDTVALVTALSQLPGSGIGLRCADTTAHLHRASVLAWWLWYRWR
ncbi:MAG: hypothetical protein AAGA84_04335 [Pseudomonadota bacterium]